MERKKRRGGVKIGQGVKCICLSVERGLLTAADEFADKKDVSRAALFDRAIRELLAREGVSVSPCNIRTYATNAKPYIFGKGDRLF